MPGRRFHIVVEGPWDLWRRPPRRDARVLCVEEGGPTPQTCCLYVLRADFARYGAEPRVDESGEPRSRARTGCSTPARGIGVIDAGSALHRSADSALTGRVGMVLVADPACLPALSTGSTRPRAGGARGSSCTGVSGRLSRPPVAAGQLGLRFVVTAVAAPPSRMRHGGHQDGPCALSPRAHPTRSPGPCSLCKPLQSCSGQSSCGSAGVASL